MSLRRTVAAAALALATLTLATHAGASPWVLKPGEFYSELTGGMFAANTFFDNDRERPPLNGKLDERELTSFTELGWKKKASVWIGVPFVNRGFTRFSGGTSTSTGLGDLDLGVRFRLKGGNLPASLAFGWTTSLGANRKLFPGTDGDGGTNPASYPPYSPSNASDTSLYFNQGLQSLRVGLDFGGRAWKHAFWNAGGEWRYRYLEFGSTGGSSHNARFLGGNAELGWWVHKNLLVTGLFQGEWVSSQSANYDQNLSVDLQPSRVLAGPRFTWRVDDRMDVFAGSWHVARGQNVIHYDQYYFGIAWRQSSLSKYAGAYGGTSDGSTQIAIPDGAKAAAPKEAKTQAKPAKSKPAKKTSAPPPAAGGKQN
jgi:hypothetical protein